MEPHLSKLGATASCFHCTSANWNRWATLLLSDMTNSTLLCFGGEKWPVCGLSWVFILSFPSCITSVKWNFKKIIGFVGCVFYIQRELGQEIYLSFKSFTCKMGITDGFRPVVLRERLQPWLSPWPSVRPRGSHFSLSLGFLTCKVGIITAPHGTWDDGYKSLI